MLTQRLNKIVGLITPCQRLFDVGCDHGYVSEYSLKNNLCSQVVISDISPLSLKKAQDLLAEYAGRVESVVCDGIPQTYDQIEQAVICGMGGEIIIDILSNTKILPQKLVLQPMKNSSKVRRFLLDKGYEITLDRVYLCEGKFYDFITCRLGGEKQVYSPLQIEFGADNLLGGGDFLAYLDDKILRLKRRNTANNQSLNQRILQLESLKNEIKRNLSKN